MDETVGDRIERLAAAKNLPSGQALAELFGVSYETLRKWKRNLVAPNRSRQQVISKALGVAPEVFMHGVAGPSAGEPLRADEARLLRAYRHLLKADQEEALKRMETRAREIEELELRIKRERPVQPYRDALARAANRRPQSSTGTPAAAAPDAPPSPQHEPRRRA